MFQCVLLICLLLTSGSPFLQPQEQSADLPKQGNEIHPYHHDTLVVKQPPPACTSIGSEESSILAFGTEANHSHVANPEEKQPSPQQQNNYTCTGQHMAASFLL